MVARNANINDRRRYQREYNRNWYQRHPEVRKKERELNKQRYWAWRGGNNQRDNPIAWNATEEYGARVLAEEGFKDIYHVSKDFQRFCFDILARKDGVDYAIDVSTDYFKTIDPKARKLANWLGLKPFALIVKPDLSEYVFRTTNMNGQHSKQSHELLPLIGEYIP